MKRHQIVVRPEVGFDPTQLESWLKQRRIVSDGQHFRINRRSVDARQKSIKVNLEVAVDAHPFEVDYVEYKPTEKNVSEAQRVIIVGAGPAGLFAALRCIELGLKPIVLERGKDVRARRRDLAAINKEHIVNPESNYCFGEGGAGTYSDGKLYTRSKKRGSIRKVFEVLVAHGATEEILFEAHPHIGTNKLPKIVTALRESILQLGGEVHFNARVTDFIIAGDMLKGVTLSDGQRMTGEAVILATGHSARDIFELLHRKTLCTGCSRGTPPDPDRWDPVSLRFPGRLFTGGSLLTGQSNQDQRCGKRGVFLLYVPGRIHRSGGHSTRRDCGQWHEPFPARQSLRQLRDRSSRGA